MSGALQAVFQNQRSFGTPPGQQIYTTSGTFSWVAPAGVTSVSVLTVGSIRNTNGSGCGAGALSYKNNYSVTPGNSYTVVVGQRCGGSPPVRSSFVNNCTVSAGINHNRTGDGGGDGGASGAGGYSGAGGILIANSAGTSGSGGGGGGGGYYVFACSAPQRAGGGGGVGLFGEGSSGAGGSSNGGGGGGGSGGTNGGSSSPGTGGNGGDYGAKGGWDFSACFTCLNFGIPGRGAVRIIWPGSSRSFPSTCVGDF